MRHCWNCHWKKDHLGYPVARLAIAPEPDVLMCDCPDSDYYRDKVDEFHSCGEWTAEDVFEHALHDAGAAHPLR